MRRVAVWRRRPPPLLLLLLVLVLLSSGTRGGARSCGGNGSTGIGTTYPREDMNLPPYTEFNITCQLDSSKPKVAGYTASDIYFTRIEVANGAVSRIDVPVNKFEVVNSTTLRLTDRLERRAKYTYQCRLRHRDTPTMVICSNHVNIGDPPLPVQNFRCVSQNWKTLNCSWQEPFNAIKTSYQPEYHTMTRVARYRKPCNSSAVRRQLRPGQTRHVSCLVSEADFRFSHETFRMVVNAHNALNSTSSKFVLNTYEIVRPAPPERVWGTNVTTNSVWLRAEIGLPMASFPKPIEFSVQLTSRWNQTPQTVDASAMRFVHSSRRGNTTETLVSGLLPNTAYRLAVRMRSSMADVMQYPDLWSPPRETVVHTLPTVPAASPRTTLGSYELEGRATSRTVYIYWQQIGARQQNGPQFGYCVELRRPGYAAVRPDRTTAAYALFRYLSLERHEFSVTACNLEGHSSPPTTLVVPAQRHVVARPRPFTVVGAQPGDYSLVWEQQQLRPPVDTYTVFWCQHTRGRPFQCEGQLNWTVVDGSRRNHSLQLSSSAEYQFAVAANRAAVSSGLVWSRCVVLATGERIQQPDGVYVLRSGATELTLGWRDDYCSSLATDNVSYKVYYCVSRRGHCLPGSVGEERWAELRANERRSDVRLTGLTPYTEYRLQVAVLSGQLEGQRSQPVVNSTDAAPPQPPTVTRVVAVNSSRLRVHWSPPERPNGQLTHYQLTAYRLHQQRLADECTVNVTGSVTTDTVGGLLPYSRYWLRLLACNEAGCSAPSGNVSGRTLMGRPGAMERPRSQLLNTSAVRVSWRPPAVPGGPQPLYTLHIVSERRGVSTNRTETLPANGSVTDGWRVAELPVPECQPGSSGRDLLTIRASVELDSGRRLDGPWSGVTQQNCVYADWPTATIVGVVVGGALLMMFVVLLFFLLCHRTKRKLSEMRNLGVNMPAGLDRAEKAHGLSGGPDGGYGRLVSQSSGGTSVRTAASVSGQPLLQEELARDECDGETSELTPVVNTDTNSCSSSATNYTDSGAECDKGASSPTYSKFDWPVPAEPCKRQLSPYVQAGGRQMAAAAGITTTTAAGAGPAPSYTKFSPYVDAKAIQALTARGHSMESLPAGQATGHLSRSEPDLSAAATAAAPPPPPYSQMGHRSSTGYVSLATEETLAKPMASAELRPYVALGPPPPAASSAGFPPYVLAGPPPPLEPALATTSAGYVQHAKLQPQLELRDLAASAAAAGYVPQQALTATEPVLSPKKLPTVATARDPYCRVVTSHQGPPDLGPNVSMV